MLRHFLLRCHASSVRLILGRVLLNMQRAKAHVESACRHWLASSSEHASRVSQGTRHGLFSEVICELTLLRLQTINFIAEDLYLASLEQMTVFVKHFIGSETLLLNLGQLPYSFILFI